MAITCSLVFPGITNFTGNATVTLSRGVQPSQFSIETAAENFEAVVGDLILTQNGRVVRRFVDCATDGVRQSSAGSTTGSVTILDRRWRWQVGGGVVKGHYNVRKTDGTIKPGTKKSPEQLISLLLDELNETGYTIDILDVDEPPEIQWDYEPTAGALGSLLQTFGLTLSINRNNRVEVYQLGRGNANIPNFDVSSDAFTLSSVAVPDALLFLGGPDVWEMLWECEAVAKQRDGKIIPLDEVEYKPTTGWERQIPGYLSDVHFGNTEEIREENRKLAQETVHKWYRLKRPAHGSDSIPDFKGSIQGAVADPPAAECASDSGRTGRRGRGRRDRVCQAGCSGGMVRQPVHQPQQAARHQA